jgi:hypothetical protein
MTGTPRPDVTLLLERARARDELARGDLIAQVYAELRRVGVGEGVGQVNHYNIACVFPVSSAAAEHDGKLAPADRTSLKAQNADRVVDFLRQAVNEGYQDTAVLKDDPDLALLPSREDFQKLVREVERKSRK